MNGIMKRSPLNSVLGRTPTSQNDPPATSQVKAPRARACQGQSDVIARG